MSLRFFFFCVCVVFVGEDAVSWCLFMRANEVCS